MRLTLAFGCLLWLWLPARIGDPVSGIRSNLSALSHSDAQHHVGFGIYVERGIGGTVFDIAVSPSGRYIAAAFADNTIKVWDAVTGQWLRTLIGHRDDVIRIAVTPDEEYIVSASWDHTIRIWHLSTGEPVRVIRHPSAACTAVTVSSDGQRILAGCTDGAIREWALSSGRMLRTVSGHRGWVLDVAVSSGDRFIVSGGLDRTVRIWDSRTGRAIRVLTGAGDRMDNVVIHPDGRYIFSRSCDGTVQMWDLRTGRTVRMFKFRKHALQQPCGTSILDISPDGRFLAIGSVVVALKTGQIYRLQESLRIARVRSTVLPVTAVAMHPHGQRMVMGGRYGLVWEVDHVSRRHIIRTLSFLAPASISIDMSRDGRWIVVGSAYGYLQAWDLATVRFAWVADPRLIPTGQVTPDGRYRIVIRPDGNLDVWELSTARRVRIIPVGHQRRITGIRLSQYGRYILSMDERRELRIWSLDRDQLIWTRICQRFCGPLDLWMISPDGVYAVEGTYDGRIKVWSVAMRVIVWEASTHESRIQFIAIDPNSRYVVTGDAAGNVTVWHLRTGQQLWSQCLFPYAALGGRITPDGTYVVVWGGHRTVQTRYLRDGQVVRVLHLPEGALITEVAIRHDARRIAVCHTDGTVHVWDPFTGKRTQVLRGVPGRAYKPQFVGHGVYLLAHVIGGDGAIRMWDLRTGKVVHTFAIHGIYTLRISPGGRYVILGGDGLTVRDLQTGRWIRSTVRHVPMSVIHDVRVSPDDRYGIVIEGNRIRVWDLSTGQLVREWDNPEGPRVMALAADHRMITLDRNNVLSVWNWETGQHLASIHTYRKQSVRVRMDMGRRYVITEDRDRKVRIWRLETGQLIQALPEHYALTGLVAVSPDERLLIAKNSGWIVAWNLKTGQQVWFLRDWDEIIQRITIAPNGRHWISTGLDGVIRLGDLNTGREQLRMIRFNDGAWVIHTAQGYMNASPQGLRYVYIIVGDRAYNLAERADWQRVLVDPDRVRKVLRGDRVRRPKIPCSQEGGGCAFTGIW